MRSPTYSIFFGHRRFILVRTRCIKIDKDSIAVPKNVCRRKTIPYLPAFLSVNRLVPVSIKSQFCPGVVATRGVLHFAVLLRRVFAEEFLTAQVPRLIFRRAAKFNPVFAPNQSCTHIIRFRY